jgi:hypothetical protein
MPYFAKSPLNITNIMTYLKVMLINFAFVIN